MWASCAKLPSVSPKSPLKWPAPSTVDHVRDLECSSSKNDLIIISGLETACWSYAKMLAVDGDRIEPDLDSLEQQTFTLEAKCRASHNHTFCEQETRRTALFKLRKKLEGTAVDLNEQRSAHTARQGRMFSICLTAWIWNCQVFQKQGMDVRGHLTIKEIYEITWESTDDKIF